MKTMFSRQPRRPGKQSGAVAVLVAFALIPLVLMLGLVLDIGHLYVVKTELQNAADSCALSGVRELNDRGEGALDRATAAALTAGNRHRIDLQQDAALIQAGDVTFSDTLNGTYSRAVGPATSYIRCAPHESNPKSVVLWFMGITGLSNWSLSADAIARTVGGQSFCAIPLAVCTSAAPGTANLGFNKGEWYTGRLSAGSAINGNYDWVRFEGQQGASDLGQVLAGPGVCDTTATRVDAQPGVASSLAQAWNTRFGLYASPYNNIDAYYPDRTGWAYTPDRLDNKGDVVPGSWPAPAPQNTYPDYVLRKNKTHDPYNPDAILQDNGKPAILPGNPAPLSRDLHASKGQDRRMVFVPVISCAQWGPSKKNLDVIDYACMLMVSPISDPGSDVRLEFRGMKENSDCGSAGVPGDLGAPIPVLVR